MATTLNRAGAGASAASKRMCLTRDQRAVLEAVYAIEKLPDAALRERLSTYLNLSARQVQVWFQNRRQRAKANSSKKGMLSTSDQIMDALFEFSGGSAARRTLNAVLQTPQGSVSSGSSSSGSLAGAAELGAGDLDGYEKEYLTGEYLTGEVNDEEDLEVDDMEEPGANQQWKLPGSLDLLLQPPLDVPEPDLRPRNDGAPAATATIGHGVELLPSYIENESPRPAAATAAVEAAPTTAPGDLATEALLGFACHAIGLDVCEFWQLRPTSNGGSESTLLFVHVFTDACDGNDLVSCRGMLALPLCEAANCSRELVWFGTSTDQQDLLVQAGVGLSTVVAVPCPEPLTSATVSSGVQGVLVLYSRRRLQQHDENMNTLLRTLGSTAAALRAQPLLAPATRFTQFPRDAPPSPMGWLLLAAAHITQADIAEHWSLRKQGSSGELLMSREIGLASDAVQGLPAVARGIGEAADALHSFSSQLSRASLFAAKLIWCNATSPDGRLEGIQLPMQTAVGLPVWSGNSTASVLLFYSLRRLEQTPQVSFVMSQLQYLASISIETPSALDAAVPPPLASVGRFWGANEAATDLPLPTTIELRAAAAPQQPQQTHDAKRRCGDVWRGAATDSAPALTKAADRAERVATCRAAATDMSTEQVLSLFDSLPDEPYPAPAAKPTGPASVEAGSLACASAGQADKALGTPLSAQQKWISSPPKSPPLLPLPLARSGCSADLSLLEL